MIEFAAILYAVLAGIAAGAQFLLAAGAPWGEITMGGLHPGRLPPHLRLATLVQSALLLSMAASVLARTGFIEGWPAWTIWPTLALTILTAIGNTITPSRPERRLWMPVTLGMLITLIIVLVTT